MIHKNGLFWADGTSCYYKGNLVQNLSIGSDANKRTLVGMGAWIVIFPDKKMYNTFDGTVKNLESEWKQSDHPGNITFAPTFQDSVLTKVTASGINNSFEINDAVTITGCSDAQFNTTKIIREKGTDYIIIDGVLASSFTVASGMVFKRKVPDMDFVCERDNRLWGCSNTNHEIYSSKLGDPTNWNSFEGISTDSYAVTVGSDGDFTGCVSHLGHVIFFKEHMIHMMYGDRPNNFSLQSQEMPGVRAGCSDSIEIVNETLFYVGRNGVYSFDGAMPQKISEVITDEITEAVATQEEGRLYLSCKMAGTQTILCYDPRLQIWDKENDEVFKFTAYGEGKGYYIDASNVIKTITGNDTEVIEWMIESGDIKEGSLEMKHVGKLMFNLWLAMGTEAMVYIKCDDSTMWVRKGLIVSDKDMTYTLPIIPERCGKYRYRVMVKGDGKIISSSRAVEGGTELNGTVHYGYRTN